jgi:hypothetical protein
MKELKEYWDKFWRHGREWWARSLGAVVVAVSAFFLGAEYQQKIVTEDCRFMGVFRDGPQAYTCQPRVR